MTAEETRQQILMTALTMFSEKGYSAVSMRDISGAVGIRAASVYYYFKSKQEIFDALIAMAGSLADGLKEAFARTLGDSAKVSKKDFVRVGRRLVTDYLLGQQVGPILQMLQIERFHDPVSDEIWKNILFEEPIKNHTLIFKALYERGAIKDKDVAALAGEYHGLIVTGYFTKDIDRLTHSLEAFYDRVFTA